MFLRVSALAAALALAAASFAHGQTVEDGNTVRVDGTTYRLWGIYAPEPGQTCARDWPAGEEASKVLGALLKDKEVECEPKGRNRDGQALALCKADGVDVGGAMVRAGMAWADLTTSRTYVVPEAKAAAEYLGIHAHHCKLPSDWRAKNHDERQFRQQ